MARKLNLSARQLFAIEVARAVSIEMDKASGSSYDAKWKWLRFETTPRGSSMLKMRASFSKHQQRDLAIELTFTTPRGAVEETALVTVIKKADDYTTTYTASAYQRGNGAMLYHWSMLL